MSPWRCEIARGDLPRRQGMGANRVSGTNLRASSLLGHQQQGRSTTSALGDLGILGAVRSLTLRHMITILMRTWWAVCLKSRVHIAFLLPLDVVPGCWCGLGVRVAGSDLRRRDRAAPASGRAGRIPAWIDAAGEVSACRRGGEALAAGAGPSCGDDVVELGAQQFLIRVHQREELLLYLIHRRDRHIAARRRRVQRDHRDHHRPAPRLRAG
jgi:hypothetical protein